MTQEKWDSMNDLEKARHLKCADREIKTQTFMDGSKKVGDHSAIKKLHKCIIGGVDMSGWCDSKQKAKELGETNLKAFV